VDNNRSLRVGRNAYAPLESQELTNSPTVQTGRVFEENDRTEPVLAIRGDMIIDGRINGVKCKIRIDSAITRSMVPFEVAKVARCFSTNNVCATEKKTVTTGDQKTTHEAAVVSCHLKFTVANTSTIYFVSAPRRIT